MSCWKFEQASSSGQGNMKGKCCWHSVLSVCRLTRNRFYYQYKPERLPCMTLTMHALLHVADTIKTIGPVWTWWSFPIKCHCRRFQRKIKSRKHPFTNLNNYLIQHAQLGQIKMIYNLSDMDVSISECTTKKKKVEFVLQDKCASNNLANDCDGMLISLSDEGITLRSCVGQKIKLLQAVLSCIYSCLFTQYGLDTGTEEEQERFWILFPKEVEVWAKATISNSDKVHAVDSVDEDLPDRRDATFVQVRMFYIIQQLGPLSNSFPQYSLLVDKMRHRRCVAPRFKGTECFGQLRSILRFDLPAGIALPVTKMTTLVLAIIWSTEVAYKTSLMIPYYKQLGCLEAVNMSTVMCVIGCVKDHRGRWAIIDQSGKSARADFTE